MRLYLKLICFVFPYLIHGYKSTIVESSGSSSTHLPKASADGQSSGSSQPLKKVEEGRKAGTAVTTPSSPRDVTTANPDRGQTAKTATGTVKKTPVELDIKKSSGTNEFEYKKVDKVVTFTAKDNYAFNVVMQDNTEIWKTEKQNEYASKVVLSGDDQKDKIVTIYLLNGIIKVFRRNAKDNTWVECTQYIKLFKADPNDTTKTKKLGTRDYKYEFDGEHVYKFNSGVKCTLLKIKEKDVWKYDSSKHKGKYPKGMGVMRETIFIYFDGCFEVYVRDGDNYKITEFSKEKTVELDIKKSDKTDKIDYNKFGNIVKYTAKGGHAFNVVKQNQNEIWRTDKEAEYSTKVVLNGKGKKNKIVTIFLLSGIKKVFKKEGKGKPWNEDKQSANDPDTKTGVDLNIKSDTQSTEQFDYKKVGQYVTYTPNPDIAFKLVMDGTTNVWEATDTTKYSSKVEVDTITTHSKAITICLGQDQNMIFIQDKDLNYKEVDTSKINPISVDISYTNETYCYKYELKDKTATLTPKKGFTFKAVNQFTDDGKVEVWRANNDKEYANKIEIESNKTASSINNPLSMIVSEGKVSIYLPGNKTKVFKKDGWKKPWIEVKQNARQGSKNSTKTASGSR